MHFSLLYSSIAFCKVCFEECKIRSPFYSCQSLLLSSSALNDMSRPVQMLGAKVVKFNTNVKKCFSLRK